jgi:hypothetical protein
MRATEVYNKNITNQVGNLKNIPLPGSKHPFLEARYKLKQLLIHAMFNPLSS